MNSTERTDAATRKEPEEALVFQNWCKYGEELKMV